MEEHWKAIAGYESFYEVSDMGRVRRIAANKKIGFAELEAIRELRTQRVTYAKIATQFGVTLGAVFIALRAGREPFKILKPGNCKGYPTVALQRDNTRKQRLVHQLVMAAFVGPVPEKHEINHKDGNRKNPALENLEYVTRSQNILHALHVLGNTQRLRRGSTHYCAQLTESKVTAMRILRANGMKIKVIAETFGVHRRAAGKAIDGTTWKHVH